MVTLQAIKHEEPHRNQQQERRSLREERRSREKSNVADDDNLKQQQRLVVGNEGFNNEDDWKSVNGLELANLRNNLKVARKERDDITLKREFTSERDVSRVWRDVSISNGYSTQCSEIEDDEEYDDGRARNSDENERDENLFMANEEENEEKNNGNDEGDNEIEEEIENANGWMRRKIVTTRIQDEDNFDDGDDERAIQQVLPNLDETSFGEINVENSSHVHVGNTNFYKGPVTIKQFVYTNAKPIKEKTNDSINCTIEDIRSGRISDIDKNNVTHCKTDPDRPILPTYGDYDKAKKWLWTWRCAAILCVLALSSVTIVVVLSLILSNKNGIGREFGLPDPPTSGINPDDVWVDSVRFIERNDWIAQPAKEKPSNLTEVPAPYVIISHTATEPCKIQSDCVLRVRLIQTFHMESRGWSDIAYNFIIGGDGLAYVGRGWDAEGAHTFGWNKKSIGISFIGTFNDVSPYKRQLHAALKLIEIGVKLGKISKNYKLLGHRQVSETLSPGDRLYDILRTWKHWSPTP